MNSVPDRNLKILYLTSRDASDKREWSGTMYYMAKSLAKHAGDVIFAGPFKPRILLFFLKAMNRISLGLFGKRYSIPYSYLLSLRYKHYFTPKIKKENPDIVVAVSASGEMSLLKTECPVVYVGDITLKLIIDNYPNFTNLARLSLWESDLLERKTYRNADALVFSSDWAVNSARYDYGVPEDKLNLISYGANMDKVPAGKDVAGKEISSPVRILFLGVDWVRKGGDIVYHTFLNLRNRGFNVELTVIGCVPSVDYQGQELKVIPFLNKNREEDANVLYHILMETHFLFVPSRSDCTPIAFCEANAFGIPVVTSDVGGITSVIQNGVNGHTLSVESPPEAFTDVFESYITNPGKYRELVATTRNYYDQNLNWDQWGMKMSALFNSLIRKN